MEVFRRLGPPLLVPQEGPLQVDAGALGPVFRPLKVSDGLHRFFQHRLLKGHGGSQVGGDPVGGVVPGKDGQPLPPAVGKVLPHGPVGVDIHKAGDDIAAFGVQVRRTFETADGLDGFSKADIPVEKGPPAENFRVLNEHR